MTDKPEALFFGEELARAWQTTAQRRLHELEKQRDELLTALKKLEYSSDGYIKRYPEEAEVNAVIARAEGKQ